MFCGEPVDPHTWEASDTRTRVRGKQEHVEDGWQLKPPLPSVETKKTTEAPGAAERGFELHVENPFDILEAISEDP